MAVTIPSRAKILAALRDLKASNHSELTDHFSLQSPMEQEALRRRLQAMMRDGQLVLARNGQYRCFHYTADMAISEVERQYHLPTYWSGEIHSVIRALPDQLAQTDYHQRQDLTKLPFVTIDGEDAKDFDDAVYCQKTSAGGWTLYVAIADVSHYVQPQSAIDQEALLRGTSVYFPGYVIPMLPEKLSNDLCSLVPHQDRLAMVVQINVSQKGQLEDAIFYPAVIHSHARLTYAQVHQFLENIQSSDISTALAPHLQQLYALYKALLTARYQRGALEFDTTESMVQLDQGSGQPIGVTLVHRNDAHRLIEECMLLASQAAARFIEMHQAHTLFRVHLPPDAQAMANLRMYLSFCGITMKGGALPSADQLTAVCRQAQGRPDEAVIQMMILRSMNQAIYTPDNDGHFGLNYDAYVQFTSPIRRYPDLIAHRVIRAILNKVDPAGYLYSYEALAELGAETSRTERQAEEASRTVSQKLKCALMHDKLGETYSGVVSGVVEFGLFVTLTDFLVDGLVPVSALHDDFYEFDRVKHQLVGKRTHRVYKQGDQLEVKIARVDIAEGKMDFDLFSAHDQTISLKKLRRRRRW